MASRTRQKEEARQRRIAAEQARLERSRRERRVRILGGTLLGAIAIVAVLVAVSSGGGAKPAPRPSSPQARNVASSVNSLIGGIPQAGNRLGSPTAPVTVTEFGDLQCPICQTFALGAESSLISHEVRAGKVKIIYRSLCTATCNGPGQSTFTTQQTAALAAGKQNLGWNYILLFYHLQGQENTGYVTPTYLNGLARLVPGLNFSQWQSDSTSSALASQVTQDQQTAASNGWTSTPTIYVSGPKGQTQGVQAALPYSELQKAIQAVS
jgi:protein-disulfide isomerase